ncbi:2-succinyl-6-hydroxy-2,4-cyclohexadiene-1- carboxylic acid synthase/2-oxoglutarate decarboxylase [Thermaerobacter marianensis DSM 12885]|uniref:Multifunctional fusion protein n=1 Tax=Thermaerobacter marianensis (strain ATCC 700841 / DSM 12885 / JCM 10246 / 7p75a) TaxID=644966 RepID=E6SH68_THEM7|nr:2-succinyl-5-enolpyruvyl-6-hydroxy-3-cyclohexene-1-carboxylic-acid synthase [Thermaerobacter marianensis]ADU51732.1 2-succinyl-6-hydroxy-2,4-cyclohexadiene-1- carboxylic acid synthase/2-oxoglutarate decarboxylase [Thermaerobacter marianensis DSM 12885]
MAEPHPAGFAARPVDAAAPAAGAAAAPDPVRSDRGRTNLDWALALMDGLVEAGVEHVVVCPGSRSTPLALAAARHPGVRLWIQLDERSAAFFALGLGRATGRPAAVVATSGTAPANFYPAVIEARYGRVPLVVLSADRPHELREFGAPQTVDQIHLYGRHAKWFADLPLPEDEPAARAFVTRAAVRAVAEALAAPAGPVHLNVPFREPLVPAALAGAGTECRLPDGQATGAPVTAGAAVGGPAGAGSVRLRSSPRGAEPRLAPAALTDAQAHELLGLLAGARRGIIVCGPLSPVLAAGPGTGPAGGREGGAPVAVPGGAPLAVALTRLARRLGLPILADPLSGVRCGPHVDPSPEESPVIDAYDAFLRDPQVAGTLAPDVVLRIGGLPVSKPLAQYLERYAGAVQIVLDEGGWPDPGHVAARVVRADPVRACQQLADLAEAMAGQAAGGPASEPAEVRGDPAGSGEEGAGDPAGARDPAGSGDGAGSGANPPPGGPASAAWLALWQRINRLARQAAARQLAAWDEPAEPRVVAELAGLLPAGTVLFAGNSMPVRDVDTFFPASAVPVRFLANRGASGIDGVVSTAAGVAAAGEGPVVLVIGDLSFYHDLNGLWAAARYRLPLVVVVVNNDGGGIFSFLPQARLDPGEFESLWGTPHGLDFRHAAALYGIPYRRASTWDDFRAAVQEALARAGTTPGQAGGSTGATGGSTGPEVAAGGPAIVEVRTDRRRNVEHHRRVWQAVTAALAEAGIGKPAGESGPGAAGRPGPKDAPGAAASRTGTGRWRGGSGGPGSGSGGAEPWTPTTRDGGGGSEPPPGGRPGGGAGEGGGKGARAAGFVRVRGVRYYIEAEGDLGAGAGRAARQDPEAGVDGGALPASPGPWSAAGGAAGEAGSHGPAPPPVPVPPPVPAPDGAGGGARYREPALLLHGFTGSAATWAGVWDELAAEGPLVAVDLLGHGRTAAPAHPARYRMEEQVADLLALLDRLGCRRIHLVGYSMGGRVALSLAAAAPERVASLVLESSSPGLADPAEREARRRADDELARRIEVEGVEAFTRHWERLPLFAGLRRLPPAAQAAVRATRLAQRPRGLANSLRGMGAGVQPPLWDRLPDLPMPVLCLAGAEDGKYAALASRMAARLPRGRAVTVPGAGHTVHLEEPAAFVREVRAFWEEVRR